MFSPRIGQNMTGTLSRWCFKSRLGHGAKYCFLLSNTSHLVTTNYRKLVILLRASDISNVSLLKGVTDSNVFFFFIKDLIVKRGYSIKLDFEQYRKNENCFLSF
jgi:hypothetical protein